MPSRDRVKAETGFIKGSVPAPHRAPIRRPGRPGTLSVPSRPTAPSTASKTTTAMGDAQANREPWTPGCDHPHRRPRAASGVVPGGAPPSRDLSRSRCPDFRDFRTNLARSLGIMCTGRENYVPLVGRWRSCRVTYDQVGLAGRDVRFCRVRVRGRIASLRSFVRSRSAAEGSR